MQQFYVKSLHSSKILSLLFILGAYEIYLSQPPGGIWDRCDAICVYQEAKCIVDPLTRCQLV